MTTTSQNQPHPFLDERLAKTVSLRESDGKTFAEIGAIIGVSASRASCIYAKAKWIEEKHRLGEKDDPLFGLSTRATNCCRDLGLENRKQVEAAIKDGRLKPDKTPWNGNPFKAHKEDRGPRKYGWKTHVEVHKWLGLPEPQQRSARQAVCPHCGGSLGQAARPA